MKKSKKILFATLSLAAVAAIVIPTTITCVNANQISKTRIPNSGFIFDNMYFNSKQDFSEYAKRFIQNVDTISGEQTVSRQNGQSIVLDQQSIDVVKNKMDAKVDKFFVKCSQDDLIKNTTDSYGTISPDWFDEHQDLGNSNINIYRGNDDKVFSGVDGLEKSVDSFMNTYDFYFFNNIYFENREDLEQYLTNYYFNDASNSKSSKTIRIKGPNGKYSNSINTANKNWKDEATKFVMENSQKVLKVVSKSGNVKYISLKNKNTALENIDIKNIPYVQIDSGNGARNWYVSLNNKDKYTLDGPAYYNGFANLDLMNNIDNWYRDETPDPQDIVYDDMLFNRSINDFFSSFFLDDISVDKNGNISANSSVLYSEVNNGKQYSTFEAKEISKEQQEIKKSLLNDVVIENGLPNGEDLVIKPEDIQQTRNSVVNTSTIASYSSSYKDLLLNSDYAYVYNELADISKQYRETQNYNFLLATPMLYYIAMDRLMTAGAPQTFIDKTRQYFKTITDTIQSVITLQLGDLALKAGPNKQGYQNLNLADLFDISLDNSQVIDFNLQEIWANLIDNYPYLRLLTKTWNYLNDKKKLGQSILLEQYKIYINQMVTADFANKNVDSSFIQTIKNNLIAHADFMLNKRVRVATENKFYNSTSNELRFKNVADYASYVMSVINEEDTSARDKILDNILDQVNELINAKKSWALIPDTNKFKLFAYILQKENNVNLIPQDFLNTINVFDYQTLLFWNNLFIQLEDTLASSNKYNEYAKILSKIDVFDDSEIKNNLFQQAYDEIEQEREDIFLETYNCETAHGTFGVVNGIVQDFNSYAAITIMRMLADIAEDDTLFINDNEHLTKTINPEFKTQATKIVRDILNDVNNLNFIPDLANLYRGFQTIQERIAKNTIYSINQDDPIILNSNDLILVLKNTAQYASIINQNFKYLADKLHQIGIKSKTGQIIAYSGTTNIENKYRDYQPNIDKNLPIYNGDAILNDVVSFIADISDDNNQVLSTYVIPDMEIKAGEINTENVNIANSVYVAPVETWDFDTIDQFDWSFDKYLDVDQLANLGIKNDDLVHSFDGLTLYYNPKYKYENEMVQSSNEYYFKKWGSWNDEIANEISSSLISSVYSPIRIGKKTTTNGKNDFVKNIVLEDQNGDSEFDVNITRNVSYYEGTKRDLSGQNESYLNTLNKRFNLRQTNVNVNLVNHANKMMEFYENKYTKFAPNDNNPDTANAVLEDLENQVSRAYGTTINSRPISYLTDLIVLNTNNGEDILKPTAKYREDVQTFALSRSSILDDLNTMSTSDVDGSVSRSLDGNTNNATNNNSDVDTKNMKIQMDNLNKPQKLNNDTNYKKTWKEKLKNQFFKKNFVYNLIDEGLTLAATDYDGIVKRLVRHYNISTRKNILESYEALIKKQLRIKRVKGWENFNLLDDDFLWHVVYTGKIDNDFTKKYKSDIDFYVQQAKGDIKLVSDKQKLTVDKILNEKYSWGSKPTEMFKELENCYNGNRKVLKYSTKLNNYKTSVKKAKKFGQWVSSYRELTPENFHTDFIIDKKYMKNALFNAKECHKFIIKTNLMDEYSFTKGSLNRKYFLEENYEITKNKFRELNNFKTKKYDQLTTNQKKFLDAEINYYSSINKQLYMNWIDEFILPINYYSLDTQKAALNKIFKKNVAWLTGNDELYDAYLQANINSSENIDASREARNKPLNQNEVNESNKKVTTYINNNKDVSNVDKNVTTQVANLSRSGGSTAIRSGSVVFETPDVAAEQKRDYNVNKKAEIDTNDFADNEIVSKREKVIGKIKNGYARVMNSSFMRVLSIAGKALNYVSTIFMIAAFVQSLIMQQVKTDYVFKTGDAKWAWKGGELWRNAWGRENITRSAKDMILNNPIMINNSYAEDYKFYNGKLYANDDELKQAFVNNVLASDSMSYEVPGATISIGYTFDVMNDDVVIEKPNENDIAFYDSNSTLADNIINNIENNSSRYTSNEIKSFSDEAFDVDWSSMNASSARAQAARSIANKIKPTFVSLIPDTSLNGARTAFAIKRRNLTTLPGNSWNAKEERVVTWEEKYNKDFDLPIDMNNMFMIDNSANNIDTSNKFTNIDVDRIEKNHIQDVKTLISSMICEAYIPDNLSDKSEKFSELQKLSYQRDVMSNQFEVYRYFDNEKGMMYFVDTFKDGKLVSSALDNLKAHIKLKEGYYKENVVTRQKVYIYKGLQYLTLDDLINDYK